MAIVTISRIQHRRGVYENLPQLASAEIGWALDQRRLFIGNGTLDEGAPEVGNTEILTQYSDLLETAETYTFKNAIAGYTPSTGPDANSPTIRTLQEKFDDFASVRDFGAKGDGATDDTDAINRALYELYCREDFSAAKKALWFPAGHYMVSESINLPPHATILGEGPYSSIVQMTATIASGNTILLKTADDLQQTDGSMGSNSANLPTDIFVRDMGFIANHDAIQLDRVKRITFQRCRFTGPETAPTSIFNATSSNIGMAVYLAGNTLVPAEDINFKDCYFTGFNVGVWSNDTGLVSDNVNISSATFDNMFRAILIGTTNGTSTNFVVTNSVFDQIYEHGIEVDNVKNFISSFNHFKEVGNHYQGAGSPASNIISIGSLSTNSASMGDEFDRNDTDAATIHRVSIAANSSYYNYGTKVKQGYLGTTNGNTVTLTDNTSSGETGIEWSYSDSIHGQVFYNLERDGDIRSGILNIAADGTTYSIDDDSTETADVGITFDISFADGNTVVNYTTSNTGVDAIMFYSIRYLSDVV